MEFKAKDKPYTFGRAVLDVFLCLITGGLWLIWIIIRYFRTH